jgi:hypothetical protein
VYRDSPLQESCDYRKDNQHEDQLYESQSALSISSSQLPFQFLYFFFNLFPAHIAPQQHYTNSKYKKCPAEIQIAAGKRLPGSSGRKNA